MCSRSSFRKISLAITAILIAMTAAACNESGEADETAESSCDEVSALKDSVTALTEIEPVADGVDALKSAAAEVSTDLEAAASAVSSDLEPSVDQVRTAFDELESTLEGLSSDSGVGAAASEIRRALTALGDALTELSTEISQTC